MIRNSVANSHRLGRFTIQWRNLCCFCFYLMFVLSCIIANPLTCELVSALYDMCPFGTPLTSDYLSLLRLFRTRNYLSSKVHFFSWCVALGHNFMWVDSDYIFTPKARNSGWGYRSRAVRRPIFRQSAFWLASHGLFLWWLMCHRNRSSRPLLVFSLSFSPPKRYN